MMEAVGSEVFVALAVPFLAIASILLYYWTGIVAFFRRQLVDEVRIQENQQQRRRREALVNDDTCSICLQQPKQRSVSSTCGHSFCGECVWSLYRVENQKILCPLCRQEMTVLFKHFESSDETQDLQQKLRTYNRTFDDSRPILRRLLELPYVFTRLRAYIFRRQFLAVFINSVRFIRLIFLVLFYVLMPLDLIPQRLMGVVGFIDDFFVVIILVVFFLMMAAIEYHRRHE